MADAGGAAAGGELRARERAEPLRGVVEREGGVVERRSFAVAEVADRAVADGRIAGAVVDRDGRVRRLHLDAHERGTAGRIAARRVRSAASHCEQNKCENTRVMEL